MPPIPVECQSPYGGVDPKLATPFPHLPASEAYRPHLTTQELAARWRCTIYTISNKYRSLGLRPIRVGKRLLFPVGQVEQVEVRSMGGEQP